MANTHMKNAQYLYIREIHKVIDVTLNTRKFIATEQDFYKRTPT